MSKSFQYELPGFDQTVNRLQRGITKRRGRRVTPSTYELRHAYPQLGNKVKTTMRDRIAGLTILGRTALNNINLQPAFSQLTRPQIVTGKPVQKTTVGPKREKREDKPENLRLSYQKAQGLIRLEAPSAVLFQSSPPIDEFQAAKEKIKTTKNPKRRVQLSDPTVAKTDKTTAPPSEFYTAKQYIRSLLSTPYQKKDEDEVIESLPDCVRPDISGMEEMSRLGRQALLFSDKTPIIQLPLERLLLHSDKPEPDKGISKPRRAA